MRHGPRSSLAYRLAVLVLAVLPLAGCAGTSGGAGPSTGRPAEAIRPSEAPGRIDVILLHLNDVYEITPIENGRVGGLARVAALRKRLLEENPNVLTVLGGDLFSPSAIGTAKVDDKRLDGEQMVSVLNAMGLDWATFGNHEFDVEEDAFLARLSESRFGWVTANVADAAGRPFPKTVTSAVVEFHRPGDPAGPAFRLGLVGATLTGRYDDYVSVTDPAGALPPTARALAPGTDAIVALTHLDLDTDVAMAESVPEIDLVLGGHEHENWAVRRGARLTPIFKADANARTVYVVRLSYDPATGDLSIRPELVPITDAMPENPEVAQIAQHWTDLAFQAFEDEGFAPKDPVAETDEDLDGRASTVRNGSDGLTDLIGQAMLEVTPGAVAAVYNSGSIRIDDVLPAGQVTQYDVIRILPFGGDVVEVDIDGALLRKVLDQGVENRGSGGFLQYVGIARVTAAAPGGGSAPAGAAGDCDCGSGASSWSVGGAPLDDARTYKVALTDFLLTGREDGLGYLTPDNPGVTVVGPHGDIRTAVIEEMKRRYGS